MDMFSQVTFCAALLSLSSSAVEQFELAVAEPCDGATPTVNRIVMSEAKPLLAMQPAEACVVAGTYKTLTAVAVQAAPNKCGAGSVYVTLSPKSASLWARVESAHIGRELVLLKGRVVVLQVGILNSAGQGKIVLGAADIEQAQLIASVLRGETAR
jgi:hypothetical protein